MTIDRRDFLVGVGATVAAGALAKPALALPQYDVEKAFQIYRPAIANQYYSRMNPCNLHIPFIDELDNILKLNYELIKEAPEILARPERIMRSLCSWLPRSDSKGVWVVPQARAFRAQSCPEFAAGFSIDWTSLIAQECAAEFREIQKETGLILPYVPIDAVPVVSMYTYQPIVAYKTRYAAPD